MMKNLSFDTGLVTFTLNDACKVSFNPTDSFFVEKLFNTFDALDRKEESYRDQVSKMADKREIFDFARKRDQEMRALIDDLFDVPVCEALFGGMNVYSLADGLPVGYIEKASNDQLDDKTANAGKGNWTKYARDLDGLGCIYNGRKNGYDWCDVFVDWCFMTTFGANTGMKMINQMEKGLGAGVKWSARYFQDAGRFFEEGPRPGDQIFFGSGSSWWHTGIVVDVRDGRVHTIEGNTSSASGVIPNGGCVAEKSYSLTYANIKGYGRPDWSLVPEETEEAAMDRYKYLKDIPAAWDQRNIVELLMDAGIIKGDGSDKTGNGDVIDLSQDMVRMLIFNYRGGCYDDAIRAKGLNPNKYR